MKRARTHLEDRVLPSYTKGEEIFNMVSHIVGGVLAIIALVATLILSISKQYILSSICNKISSKKKKLSALISTLHSWK